MGYEIASKQDGKPKPLLVAASGRAVAGEILLGELGERRLSTHVDGI